MGSLHLPIAYGEERSAAGHHPMCIYTPMRETIEDFTNIFGAPRPNKLPLPLLKRYVRILLRGLAFLHDKCNTIHTDIRPDNILVTWEDESAIDEYFQERRTKPIQYKVRGDGRHVYRKLTEFPALKEPKHDSLMDVLPKLADFGSADVQPEDAVSIQPAGAHHYRAPEVLLGLGWSTPIDIWSLGAVIWELVEGRMLFDDMPYGQNTYRPEVHLAYIYALLGKPSVDFVKRVDEWNAKGVKFGTPLRVEGLPNKELVKSPRELWGGPYFDPEGNFLQPDLIPQISSLGSSVETVDGEEKERFLRFVERMLTWDPRHRATARELIKDPWLEEN